MINIFPKSDNFQRLKTGNSIYEETTNENLMRIQRPYRFGAKGTFVGGNSVETTIGDCPLTKGLGALYQILTGQHYSKIVDWLPMMFEAHP